MVAIAHVTSEQGVIDNLLKGAATQCLQASFVLELSYNRLVLTIANRILIWPWVWMSLQGCHHSFRLNALRFILQSLPHQAPFTCHGCVGKLGFAEAEERDRPAVHEGNDDVTPASFQYRERTG